MSKPRFNLSDETTLNLGTSQAPFTLTAILNLGCVYSQAWWRKNEATLLTATQHGQLSLHLKFWNKPTALLQNGNAANLYIDYQRPQAALAFVRQVFQHQDALKAAADPDAYLQATTHLAPLATSVIVADQVAAEAVQNHLTTVPSFVINDQLITGSDAPQVADFLQQVARA